MKYVVDMLTKEQGVVEGEMVRLQSEMHEKNEELTKLGFKANEIKRALQAIKMMN